MNNRTSKEDERARELIRQEIEQGLESLQIDDFDFRSKYWHRPLTEPEMNVLRKRLENEA